MPNATINIDDSLSYKINMNDTKKIYWKGLEQLSNDPEYVKYAGKEFPEYLPVNGEETKGESSSRRDFLKLMGFGVAAATLASCEAPIRNAIPYVNKPEDIDPGVPNYYASSYWHGGYFASVVVKTREGRPIKIEGNTLCGIGEGGSSAQVDAAILSLYDKERLKNPKKGNEDIFPTVLSANIRANSHRKMLLINNGVLAFIKPPLAKITKSINRLIIIEKSSNRRNCSILSSRPPQTAS